MMRFFKPWFLGAGVVAGAALYFALPASTQVNIAGMRRDAANPIFPNARTNLLLPVDVRAYGARCDVVSGIDGSMTAASAVLTSTGATFPASSVGKRVVVPGAGVSPFSALVRGSTIAAAGTGYAANDTITLTGGTFSQAVIVQVLTVGGSGEVLTLAFSDAGAYTGLPSNPVAQGSTSGAGTGFTLTAKFVGAPLSGTITAASGTSTATLSVAATNTISSNARWYYGTDDATSLQTAFDATKSTGSVPGQVIIPGSGCGTTVQLELPVVGSGNAVIGQGEVLGTSAAQSVIYAMAPMTAVLHRSSSFGWYGGAQNLRIEGNYLADHGVYTEGSVGARYRDIFIENTKVSGMRVGNGSGAVTQQILDHIDYRTDPNVFSSRQRPDYGIWMNPIATDNNIIFPTVSGATLAAILNDGSSNQIIAGNVYGSPSPDYCPTYGVDFSAGGTLLGTQVGCASTAGVRVAAQNVSIVSPYLNQFTGLPNALGVLIDGTRCNVSVTGATAFTAAMQGAKLVSQSGTACATTSAMNNSSATYSAFGSAGSGLQVVTFAPADPTGTTSTSQVMAGLGATATITPAKAGRVLITISGQASSTVTGNGAFWQIRTGTGSAPANGNAATGTAQGNTQAVNTTAAYQVPFSTQAVVTGLTVGTAYWVDIGQAAVTGGTATVKKLTIVITEL